MIQAAPHVAKLPAHVSAAKASLPVVYFLMQAGRSLVKIGYTTDLPTRHSTLECGAGCDLQLIRKLDGGRPTERWLHARFAAHRERGEWFQFDEEMLSVRPPDELPVIPKKIERRDIGLTLRERVREVRALGNGMGCGAREQLLMLASRLADEEAEEAIRHLEYLTTAQSEAA
jgi:hypothetical protein